MAGPLVCLYYPHMLTGRVFRVPVNGGSPALLAEDVHKPVAVRFDRDGALVVLSREVVGLDNAAFDSENLVDGEVVMRELSTFVHGSWLRVARCT